METKSEAYQNHAKKMSESAPFEDYVAELMINLVKIPLINFKTKKYQFSHGENAQGFEIKWDRQFKTTGNLFIEVQERIGNMGRYVDSGIFRNDNSLYYIQGDFGLFYVFQRNILQHILETLKYVIIEINERSAKGFLLPVSMAEKYAGFKIEKEKLIAIHGLRRYFEDQKRLLTKKEM